MSPRKANRPATSNVAELEESLLTIGALAKACNITVRTLRYYEELDLIGPIKRTDGKYRLYNERSLKRVKAILALQDLAYSLEQIATILGPYTEGLDFSKQERIAATQKSLGAQKTLIDGKLVSLNTIRNELEHRLAILESVCHPCHQKDPDTNCHEGCEYRDVHLS